jgi:Zn-dependent peptidase ImmA (M78 family)
VIYIGAELTDEAQVVTLIHEILHVCNATMDHEFLDSLAEQLGQVFIENNLLK